MYKASLKLPEFNYRNIPSLCYLINVWWCKFSAIFMCRTYNISAVHGHLNWNIWYGWNDIINTLVWTGGWQARSSCGHPWTAIAPRLWLWHAWSNRESHLSTQAHANFISATVTIALWIDFNCGSFLFISMNTFNCCGVEWLSMCTFSTHFSSFHSSSPIGGANFWGMGWHPEVGRQKYGGRGPHI